MTQAPHNNVSGQNNELTNNQETFDALSQDIIEVSGNEFIANAEIIRDGQDLHLNAPDGNSVVIENYFLAEPAPIIQSADGSILSENLVESFVQSSAQYAQTSTLSDESPVGAVEEVSGQATVIRVDGTSEPITLGTPIYQGDIIETSAEGAVNIAFIDETSMAVSEDARMAIDEYQFDPATESGTTNLSVLRGVFVFTSGLIGRDDPDDVLIDTPVGSIGIRGTIIAGKIKPGEESEITVVEGAIVVKNGAAEHTLSQQFETVKLAGFNDNIENTGVKNAGDVNITYGSVSGVVPKLFSSINDAVKEDRQQRAEEAQKEAEANAEQELLEAEEEVIEEEASEEEKQQDLQQEEVKADNILKTADDLTRNDFEKPLKNPSDELKEFMKDKNPNDFNKGQVRDFLKGLRDEIKNDDGTVNDPPPPPPTDGGTDNPFTLTLNPKPLFEGAKDNGVVAKLFAQNANGSAVTYTFNGTGTTTSADGNFKIVNVASGVEVQLTSAGQTAVASGGPNPVGHSFASLTIDAITSDGNTSSQTITPQILDAAVVLGSNNGLDYGKQAIGTTALPATKIGDFDGDGDNDFARIDGSGRVIIDDVIGTGQNNSAGVGYDQFSNIGDIDNDGLVDVIAGDSTSTNGRTTILHGDISTPSENNATGTNSGDQYGASVTGLGDFDGDGISDYAVGATGSDAGGTDRGTVYIEKSTGQKTINGHVDNQMLGDYVENINDINGDGKSDLLIGAAGTVAGNYEAYVILGGVNVNLNTSALGASGFKISTPQEILGGGAVGDFNGDGFDDFAVSLKDGGDVNTYVIYGKGSTFSTIDIAYLENPDNAVKIHHPGGYNGNDYDVIALGDVNGDGFDSIRLGPQGGNHFIVHGQKGGLAAYAEDQSATDGDATIDIVTATGTGQSLLGGLEYNDGGHSDLRINGDGRNNQINLTLDSFKDIDGGAGHDTINVHADLDFSNINFEQIKQVESINFDTNSSIVTITAENLFNLLKTSDEGKLFIDKESAISGESFNIDATVASGTATSDVVGALNEHVSGASHEGTVNLNGETYDHYAIGGYSLYIDTDVNTQVV